MKTELSILVVNRTDNENRRKAICDVIQREWQGLCKLYQHDGGAGGWEPPVPEGCSPDLVLFHWSDKQALVDNLAVTAPINRASIRIAYSGGGLSQATELPKGWLRIPRSFKSAESLRDSEWRELLLWVADPNRSKELPPALFEPPWPEELVAVYFALVAAQRTEPIELSEEIWTLADKQVRKLIAAYCESKIEWKGFNAGGIVPNREKLATLRAILTEVAQKQAS